MGSDVHHFHVGQDGNVRILSRYEDDTGRVGHARSDIAPQPAIAGIPWEQFVAAGSGIIERAEDGTSSIRRAAPGDGEVQPG